MLGGCYKPLDLTGTHCPHETRVRDSITCDTSACDAAGCAPEWSFKMGGNTDCHDAGDGFTYCFCHAYNVSYACTLCSQEPDLEDKPKNPKGLRYNTKKK
jgi:hypothetical protein